MVPSDFHAPQRKTTPSRGMVCAPRPCDPRRRSQRPARLAGCRCPRYPRPTVRLCHGLWQRARALSGSADADEAVSDRWAQANATERARIAVVSTFFCVGDTWGRERGAGRLISAPLAFLEDEGPATDRLSAIE